MAQQSHLTSLPNIPRMFNIECSALLVIYNSVPTTSTKIPITEIKDGTEILALNFMALKARKFLALNFKYGSRH